MLATEETQLDIGGVATALAARSAEVSESPATATPEVPESAVQSVATNDQKAPSAPPSSGWSSVLDAQGTASGW